MISLAGDYYVCTNSGIGSQPVTVAFWAAADESGDVTFVHIGDYGRGMKVSTSVDGYVKAVSDNGSVREAVSTQKMDGTLHHICVVFAYAARTVYIDGIKNGEDIYNLSVSPSPSSIWVGNDAGEGENYPTLQISELCLWSAELSAAQILPLANGAPSLTVAAQSIIRYWPMVVPEESCKDVMVGAELTSYLGGTVKAGDFLPITPWFQNRQMLFPSVPVAPWLRLAPWYSVSYWLSGVDISEYVDYRSVSIKDTGGIELETTGFTMRTPAASDPLEWRELQVFLDYGLVNQMCIFAGHVTRDSRTFSASGVEVFHDIKAEGYKTLLTRSKPFSAYWKDQTAQAIVEGLLTGGEVSGFTVQATVQIVPYWTKDLTESVAKNIDRLCDEYNWRWRVTWEKVIVIGPEGEDVAPFGVCEASEADYFLLYPVEQAVRELDGASVTNAILLTGGTGNNSATETFTGDGVTTQFNLAVHPIASITSVKVDGVIKSWGTIGYHNCAERDVLVHFAGGYISCCTAPASGKPVEVIYTYDFPYTYEAESVGSQSHYMQTLWELVEAPWISDDTQAAEYCASIFANRAYSPTRLTTETRRAGLRAGQTLPCAFPSLGLDVGTNLHIESIGISLDEKRRLRFSLRISPPDEKLSKAIAQTMT